MLIFTLNRHGRQGQGRSAFSCHSLHCIHCAQSFSLATKLQMNLLHGNTHSIHIDSLHLSDGCTGWLQRSGTVYFSWQSEIIFSFVRRFFFLILPPDAGSTFWWLLIRKVAYDCNPRLDCSASAVAWEDGCLFRALIPATFRFPRPSVPRVSGYVIR